MPATVKYEKDGVKSKGFGFVTFRYQKHAELALKEPNKQIDGRMTQVLYLIY
jgi:RNA recognition motif-containing protein